MGNAWTTIGGHRRYDVDHIAFLDLVDALIRPAGPDLPPQLIGHDSRASQSGNAFLDEGFDQIGNLVDNQSPTGFPFFCSRVAAFQTRREYLLSLSPRHGERDATVGADGEFAQARTRTSHPIEDDENLPAFRGDLDAHPGWFASQYTQSFAPIGSASMAVLLSLTRGMIPSRMIPGDMIGSTEEATTGIKSYHNPHKPHQTINNINLRERPSKHRLHST